MANDLIETVPFSFEDTYNALVVKMHDLGYDSVFEGSNTAQMITAMTYLVSMLNANTAANVNEMLLPLAQKRKSILNDARVLGYEPSHIVSYKYKLTLSFAAGSYTIPKYSAFSAGGKNYYYMENDIQLTNVLAGHTIQIDVIEGTLHKFADNLTTLKVTIENITNTAGNIVPQYYVDIPFTKIEDNGIEAFLTYYDAVGTLHTQEQWYKSPDILIEKDLDLTNKFIRLDNIDIGSPRIYFSLAGIGTLLRIGTIVELNVLESSGDLGSMDVLPSTTITGCTVTVKTLVTQGSTEEDNESIRANAPLVYNSANRAVTTSDYKAICNRHQAVSMSEIWGGEDEYPEIPGHIWFSLFPGTHTRTFTNDVQKLVFNLNIPYDDVNNFIEDEEWISTNYDINGRLLNPGVSDTLKKYAIPTLKFHLRHPMFIDFSYNIRIMKYSIKDSKANIHQLIFDTMNTFFKDNIENFHTEYFGANLTRRIDSILTDTSGVEIFPSTIIPLSKKHINYEDTNLSNGKITLTLSYPYENVFDSITGNLITAVMPTINTTAFLGFNLTVDWAGLIGDELHQDMFSVNILHNALVVGKYTVFNSHKRYILIELYVKKVGATGVYVNGFNSTAFDTNYQNLTLNLYSYNIKMHGNVIPRLNTVTFV